MRYLISTISLGLLLATMPAHADMATGKRLHDESCTSCHVQEFGGDGSGMYTRENSFIKNMDSLYKQVNFCKNNIGLPWFDEEVESVVRYLNQQYYRFE